MRERRRREEVIVLYGWLFITNDAMVVSRTRMHWQERNV